MDMNGCGRRRNRSWPEALKREIVAASFEPGASVSVVARRYEVNANQVFGWRKLYRDGLVVGSGGPALVPVTVADAGAGVTSRPDVADTIEIEVPGGYRIRVGSGVDGKGLRRGLDALAGRWYPVPAGGGGTHGHAPRHEQPGAAGAGGARPRPARRRSVRVPRCQRRSDQDPLA